MSRDFIFVNCQDGLHKWKSIGGKNAGCGDTCGCSVPVHECTVCGDCDYGQNADADEVRATCEITGTMNIPRPSLRRLI